MNLLERTKIGIEEIEYINQFTLKGMSQRDIVKAHLPKDATDVEIETMFQRLKGRIKNSPYRLNEEKKIYELDENKIKGKNKKSPKKQEIKTEKNSGETQKIVEEKAEIKEVPQPKNEVEKEVSKTSKSRFTKKELKINPVQLTDGTQILCDIYTVNEGKSNRKGVGAYLMKDIEAEFKVLEEEFDFIPSYALIDGAIIRCNQFKQDVETSDLFEEFKNLARKDEKANRKQTNIKLTQATVEAIDELSRHFYFLNKTEIINLSMFVLSKSAQNSFLKSKN